VSRRILIVEDEAPILAIWERIFTRLGHEPMGATDGVAALQALRDGPFDILITDLRMPRMSGFELLEIVQDDPTLQGMETFVCSGFVDDRAQLDGLRVRRVIAKPFRVAEELKYFREVLADL
jgi:two-component system cell cycle response regulator CpdR